MAHTPEVGRAGNPLGRWFGDLPVAARIFAAVGATAIAAVAAGVLAVAGLASVYQRGEAIERDNLRPALELSALRAQALTARIAIRDVALSADKKAAC